MKPVSALTGNFSDRLLLLLLLTRKLCGCWVGARWPIAARVLAEVARLRIETMCGVGREEQRNKQAKAPHFVYLHFSSNGVMGTFVEINNFEGAVTLGGRGSGERELSCRRG